MSDFDRIRKEIAEDVKQKQLERAAKDQEKPKEIPKEGVVTLDDALKEGTEGADDAAEVKESGSKAKVGEGVLVGVIYPLAGTEVVRVETNTFLLVEFVDSIKHRHCFAIVDKTGLPVYKKDYMDTKMRKIIALLTERTFGMLVDVFLAANRQIVELRKERTRLQEENLMYKDMLKMIKEGGHHER